MGLSLFYLNKLSNIIENSKTMIIFVIENQSKQLNYIAD